MNRRTVANPIGALLAAILLGGCQIILGVTGQDVLDVDAGQGARDGGVPNNCSDGVKNGDETDVDCGGPCPNVCAEGEGCVTGADCVSNVCDHGTCLAVACSDQVKNGGETDVDCGGTCGKCDAGKQCLNPDDCKSGLCSSMVCESICTDGAQGGYETDIDCGGFVCPACADGLACQGNDDCDSGICKATACLSSYIWSQHYGGSASLSAAAVAVDSTGNISVAGTLSGSADLGGGQLTSLGGADLLVARFDSSGAHLWSHAYGGPSTQSPAALAVDGKGNTIVAGAFYDTIDFGMGPMTSVGARDILVASFSPSGKVQWSDQYGDSSDQSARGVATDQTGNSYVVGMFSGTTYFGANKLTAPTGSRAFVTKLSTTGNPVWSKQFGDEDGALAEAVATDGSGNIIVAGGFQGSIGFGGPTFTTTGSSIGSSDVFVAKLNASSGNHVWSAAFGASDADRATSVAVDSSGNVFVAGTFQDTVDFGGGPLTSIGAEDVFLIKLDSAGTLLWSNRIGSTLNDQEPRISVDELGDVYLTGGFRDTINLGGGKVLASAGDFDVMIVKYDASGKRTWAKRFGDVQAQYASGIAAAGQKQVVAIGGFAGSITFGAQTDQLIASGPIDIYLARLLTP